MKFSVIGIYKYNMILNVQILVGKKAKKLNFECLINNL